MAARSYLELCADVAQRQTVRHRQEVRARKWRDRRRLASQVAVAAAIGTLVLYGVIAMMM